jgi:predicted RNA-binding Zn ribbon-like protein
VRFAHDTEAALAAAVALVNSGEPPDTLESPEDLEAFVGAHEYTGSRTHDREELEAVRALRPTLRTLLTSSKDDAAELVNRLLAEARALPQLVRHGSWDWHLHAVSPDQPFATRIAVDTAMAVADLIRADELSRLSTCADEGCDGLVLDLTRNRSRRFCSTTCGNRVAVAAYRARKAEAELGEA